MELFVSTPNNYPRGDVISETRRKKKPCSRPSHLRASKLLLFYRGDRHQCQQLLYNTTTLTVFKRYARRCILDCLLYCLFFLGMASGFVLRIATLAVSEGASNVQRSSRYRPDGVTERLKLQHAERKSALKSLVQKYLHHFTEKKVSLLLFYRMPLQIGVCKGSLLHRVVWCEGLISDAHTCQDCDSRENRPSYSWNHITR